MYSVLAAFCFFIRWLYAAGINVRKKQYKSRHGYEYYDRDHYSNVFFHVCNLSYLNKY